MNVWWDALDGESKVYYAIAIVTSAILAVQIILMFVGIDADGDIDVEGGDGLDGDAGLNVLSIRSITAFFTGFGWGGVAAVNAGWSTSAAALTALAAGSVFMAGVIAIMRAMMAMQASGTLNYANALGHTGSVYLPIQAAMSAPGKIEVLVQGRLAIVDAFTRADRRLENRERVKVVEVLDQTTVIVEPVFDLTEPASAALPSSQEQGT